MKIKISKRKKRLMLITGVLGLAFSLLAVAAHAEATLTTSQGVSKPLVLLITLAGLSLVPFFVMMGTSFVKIAVVLALIRSALGTQQVPPNVVVTGLAMILTVYIMLPVGYNVYRAAGGVINQGTNQPLLSQTSVELLLEASKLGKEPIRDFLVANSHPKEVNLFYNLAKKMQKNPEDREKISEKDFINLIPAFVISELTEAFQIGFVIFLPFLVIDLVVANVLLSLGMFQISPITISLPFKLLLFVLVDGWHVLTKGLLMGYV